MICTGGLSLALFWPLPYPRTPMCSHNLQCPAVGERQWHCTAGQQLQRSPAEEQHAQWWHGGIDCPLTYDPAQHCSGHFESKAARPLICMSSRDWDSPPHRAEQSDGLYLLQRLYHSTCHTAQDLLLFHSASSASGSERFFTVSQRGNNIAKKSWMRRHKMKKKKSGLLGNLCPKVY